MRARTPRGGQLFVLSGPSGVGKSTLIHRFCEVEPRAAFSISTTTRPRRNDETDGVDYFFVSLAEFEAARKRGEFVEWAEVHGHLYGTQTSSLKTQLEGQKTVLLELDYQGASKIKARWPQHSVAVFMLPPSWEELERRLRGRLTDDEATISLRLRNAVGEIESGVAHYDYLFVNDDLEEALGRLRAISDYVRTKSLGQEDENLAKQVRPWRLADSVDTRQWLSEHRPPV